MALAGMAQRAVMASRRLLGGGHTALCWRGGIRWNLDLREGIDFSIFLLGAFERRVIRKYASLVPSGGTAVDIGANIGAHALPLARCVGPMGRLVAVEPTRYAFLRLRDHVQLNPDIEPRVTTVQAMMMDSLSAAIDAEIPSSWPLDIPAGAHPEHAGVPQSTEGARVLTLDALVEELGLQRLDFMKLDVDGYELDVVKGGRQALARFKPTIVFEYAPYTLVEKGRDPAEYIGLLVDLGYRFTALDGERFTPDGLGVPEVPVGAGIIVVARTSPMAA